MNAAARALCAAVALAACGEPTDPSPDTRAPVGDAIREMGPLLDEGPDDAATDLGPAADAEASFADLDVPPDAVFDAAPPPDGPEPDAAPLVGPRLVTLFEGSVALGARATFTLDTALGPDEALFLEARGRPEGVYQFTTLRGPGGPLVGEPAGERLSRTSANPETATALLPNDDAPPDPERFPAGDYDVWVSSLLDERGEVDLHVRRVRAAAEGATVHVFVPGGAAFAGEAGALERFALALPERLRDRLGLEAEVELHTLAAEAPTELFLDVAQGDLGGFGELGAALPEDLGPGLRLYLVDQIHDGANTIGGLSGGLPVPALPGRGAADVTALRAKLLPDFPEAVADAASHELGHALGLWHTTEPFGDRSDPLSDTAECPLGCDTDGDGLLLARECGAHAMLEPPCRGAADNFMFWTLGGEWRGTPGQARVVARHPVLR